MLDAATYAAVMGSVAGQMIRRDGALTRLAAIGVVFPAWQAILRGAQRLDAVAMPALAHQPVNAPVFVVGHPRSGTTFLHRLLALDPRFTAMTAWHLVAPSVTLRRAASRTPGARRLAEYLDHRLFGPLASRHETGWHLPEEDDWLFLHAAASPTLAFLSGNPAHGRQYWLGDDLPPNTRAGALQWYLRCVRGHLADAPAGTTLLSKNPHFTGWLRTLHTAFPGATFVMMVRNPADAIASRLDLLRTAWGLSQPAGDPRLREAADTSVALYRHAERVWPTLDAARRARVAYDDLVADPLSALEALYDRLCWPITPTLRRDWSQAADVARGRMPRQPPRLRHFGLRERDLNARLADLPALAPALGRRR